MAATKQSLTAAINLLKNANWRSKHVRNAVAHLEAQRRSAPFDAITWVNFHDATSAMFYTCKAPARQPDFISPSGSMYWQTPTGVVRMSDHWGHSIKSCNWYLRGAEDGETSIAFYSGFYAAGYCSFESFINGWAEPSTLKVCHAA